MMNETERLEFLTGFAQRMKLDEEETECFIHHSLHWQGKMWLNLMEERATVADWKKYNENFINHITEWDMEDDNLAKTKVWRIPMAGDKELCVQIYRDAPEFPEEITVFLKHQSGFEQGIALIRPHHDDSPDNPDFEVNRDKVDVLVCADETSDFYTDSFLIETAVEEEEE